MEFFDRLHDPEPPEAADETFAAVRSRADGIRRRSRRRNGLVLGSAVLLLLVAGVGAIARFSEGDSTSDCTGGVKIGGLSYLAEDFNAGVLEIGDLGEVVGVVQRTNACPGRDGDASDLPVGTELRAAEGVSPEVLIAAEVERRVVVFRSLFPPSDLSVEARFLLDDVVEIRINSDYDGLTSWATVTDSQQVAVVVEGALTATPTSPDWTLDGRVSLEFVRTDGLRTQVSYLVDDGVVSYRDGGLQLPPEAMTVIEAALADAPPAPVEEGLELVGSASTGAVHRQALCRLDRPDLISPVGETLQLAGPRSSSITFVFVSGPEIDAYGIHGEDLAKGIKLPDDPGPVMVELSNDRGTALCSVVQVADT